MPNDRPERSSQPCEETFTNGNDQIMQRTTGRHSYPEVNLYHSQAHIGDSIHNNSYHTHTHHHQDTTKQVREVANSFLLPAGYEDLEGIAFFVLLLLCAHTGASIMHLAPCIGTLTWNRHLEIPLRIRIGAAASILKHGVLLGFSIWDINMNGRAVLKRYSDHFILSWLVLTSMNMPRTMRTLDMMDANGQVLMCVWLMMHLVGEIMEHFICVMYLKSRWIRIKYIM